jgi:Ca-activated chloride channel family protein
VSSRRSRRRCTPRSTAWPRTEAPTSQDLAQIYESLGSRVGSTYEEQEVTQYFAAAALVFAVTGAGLAALWFDRFP